MKRKVRLLDIDNCISNDGWRIPEIKWSEPSAFKRYHDYHMLAPWDSCGNLDLFTGIEHRLVLLTARPLWYRRSTEEWLQRNGVRYEHLIMRNNWDERASARVKQGQVVCLSHYDIFPNDILDAYDDREEIVEMYRKEFGISAHVRALHGVCAYTNSVTGENTANGEKAA